MEVNWLERTQLLLGEQKLNRLKQAHVLVAGLGGVGSYVVEQLARAGIGQLTLVDGDVVQPSNRNRQLPALCSTQGQAKSEVIAARLRDINPQIVLTIHNLFLRDDEIPRLLQQPFDFVVDAIDTLSPKVFFMAQAVQQGQRLVSSMGAGGKMDPSRVSIVDLSETYHCNLSRMVRKRLGKFGLRKGIPVVFSPEEVDPSAIVVTEGERNKKTTVGTISYMPALFGLYAASYVIRELIADEPSK